MVNVCKYTISLFLCLLSSPDHPAFWCHYTQKTKWVKSKRSMMLPLGFGSTSHHLGPQALKTPSISLLLLYLTWKERLCQILEIARTSTMNYLNNFLPNVVCSGLPFEVRPKNRLKLILSGKDGEIDLWTGLDSSGGLCKESENQMFNISRN